MPTGYTAKIADGITFNEFVMTCARGMGALIMMRDEPMDAPVPERFEPSDYNATKLVAAEMELNRLRRMTPAEAEEAARTEFMEESARHVETMQKNDDLRKKYEAMCKSTVDTSTINCQCDKDKTPVDSLVICPSCEGFGEGCQLCNGSGKVKKLIADTMTRVTPLPRKTVMVSTL